jgi:hypothetical protein
LTSTLRRNILPALSHYLLTELLVRLTQGEVNKEMKSCPTCNRTYPDDTLAFCLVDGAILSAPYDPQATLIIPETPKTSPPPPEILPKTDVPKTIRTSPPSTPAPNATPRIKTDTDQIRRTPSEFKKRTRSTLKIIGWSVLIGMIVGTIGKYIWIQGAYPSFVPMPWDELIIFGTLIGGLIGGIVLSILWAIINWLRND